MPIDPRKEPHNKRMVSYFPVIASHEPKSHISPWQLQNLQQQVDNSVDIRKHSAGAKLQFGYEIRS